MFRKTLAACGVLALAGCTSVQVNNVDTSVHDIDHVCIQRNPKVIVSDFLGVLQQGLMRHGIQSSVHDAPLPEHCSYSLQYTAERGWDLAPYLDHAEIYLNKDGRLIGSADYRHSGGFGLNKWASTATKMNPVIDQLFGKGTAD